MGGVWGGGVVDKLTLNSETVVNTGRKEKENILNVAHLVTKSCKKKEEEEEKKKKLSIKV